MDIIINASTLTQQELQTIEYYNVQGQEWSEQHAKKSFWDSEMHTFTNLLPEGNILELGVGNGLDAYHLIKYGYEYTGIDLSETFLNIARKNNPTGHFLQESLYNLPFQPHSFNGFWAAAIFLHVPKNRINGAFEELKKVLRPGAVGFISLKEGVGEAIDEETGRFFAYYQADEFKQILTKHNFGIIQELQRTEAKRIKIHTWLCFLVTYQPSFAEKTCINTAHV